MTMESIEIDPQLALSVGLSALRAAGITLTFQIDPVIVGEAAINDYLAYRNSKFWQEHSDAYARMASQSFFEGPKKAPELPAPWVATDWDEEGNAVEYILFGSTALKAVTLRKKQTLWYYKLAGQPKAGNIEKPLSLQECAREAAIDLLFFWNAAMNRVTRYLETATKET